MFVASEIAPHVDAWDEAGAVPADLHERAGALGVFGFGIDERFGGLGFDDCFMRAAHNEEMTRCGASRVVAAIGGRTISLGPIQKLAGDHFRELVLPEIVSGQKGASLAVTEPAGGSDVARMRTRARRDGNHYVLNGEKTFITGGMHSDYFVVGTRSGGEGVGGISLFFVEADAQGVSRTRMERKMGWWCSDQATLYFDECRVPASSLMGEEDRGFLANMDNFNYERIALVAGMLGMMKARCQ